jgi:transposase
LRLKIFAKGSDIITRQHPKFDIIHRMETQANTTQKHRSSQDELVVSLQEKVQSLEQQLNWFKRQLFGEKSEKFDMTDNPYQQTIADVLGQLPELPDKPNAEKETITYQRGKAKKNALEGSPEDSGLRFDDSVPVEEIILSSPELEGPDADDYEVIGTKNTYRLAEHPGRQLVLKYIRKVLKKKSTQAIITPVAPSNVLDKSFADVSFLAGLLIDKFCYHLPLYRQHQRLEQNGFKIARSTLTALGKRSIELLKPIAEAQLKNILLSKTLAMDETPIKAGRKKKGKMKQAYFWPIYGEQDEVSFTFSTSRSMQQIEKYLGDFKGTLLSDGYKAYEQFQKNKPDITHAQCWAHNRRYYEKAKDAEPEMVGIALTYIARLYVIEQQIRDKKLTGEAKLKYRMNHSKPVVDAFFNWCHEQRQRIDLVSSNPLSKALSYSLKRTEALKIFLSDPDVPIDTNHLERALRAIPMGRKAWLFCWTEFGAEQVGIIQSLLVSCKLHGVNFYDYLVDVLQRISVQPASKVEELTPRVWKNKFALAPMRSDVAKLVNNGLG